MSWLGASLAWAWSQVNLWHGRADNAWGTSRVWNSGTSFESAYNSEVTLYNNSQAALATMTTDRNNWQTNANTAYVSGTWGSGQTWQAKDAADTPPALDQTNVTGSRITWSTSETNILSFTTDRAGYWWAAAALKIFSGSGDNTTVRLKVAGTVVASVVIPASGGTCTPLLVTSAAAFAASGTTIQLTCQNATNPANQDETKTNLSGGFMATPAYPH